MSDEERTNTSDAAVLSDDKLNDVSGGMGTPWNYQKGAADSSRLARDPKETNKATDDLIYPG